MGVAATAKTVSVMAGGARIAIHERAWRKGEHRPGPEHMPDAHRDYARWNAGRFRSWARGIGDGAAGAIDAVLASRKIEQQSYRSCRAAPARPRKDLRRGASGGGARKGVREDFPAELQDHRGHRRRPRAWPEADR